jgi:hypothetical protein
MGREREENRNQNNENDEKEEDGRTVLFIKRHSRKKCYLFLSSSVSHAEY